jgi:PAS domain-containing protein
MGGVVVTQPPLEDIEAGRRWTQFQLYAAIVNSSDDAIAGLTVDGVVTSWNPAAERMYGYPAGEVIGQPARVMCLTGPARSRRSWTGSAEARASRTTRP